MAFGYALLLSFLAGTATGIGGLFSLGLKKDQLDKLAVCLGFSAGMMLYVSFLEMMPHAKHVLQESYGAFAGECWVTVLFFGGAGVAWCMDRWVPANHIHCEKSAPTNSLKRVGLLTALAIAIHNLPEGLATFMAATENATLGISIALAVALHNIPEGMAVALPVYQATGSRQRAFWYSFGAGLTEPLGAVCGFLFFRYKSQSLFLRK